MIRNVGSQSVQRVHHEDSPVTLYRMYDHRTGRGRVLRSIEGGASPSKRCAARQSAAYESADAQENIPLTVSGLQAPPTPINQCRWEKAIRAISINKIARRFKQMHGQFPTRRDFDTLVAEVGELYRTEVGVMARAEFLSQLDGMLRDGGEPGLGLTVDWL